MSSRQGQTDAAAELQVSLSRTAQVESGQRALSIALADESQRLIDVSEKAATLEFILNCTGVQEGDTVTAELLWKTGADPDDGTYSPASGDWNITPASGSPVSGAERLRLTVPQGQTPGTYRLHVSILDPAGDVVAEQPYHFIVE